MCGGALRKTNDPWRGYNGRIPHPVGCLLYTSRQGADALNQGLQTLSGKSEELNQGAAQLKNGLDALAAAAGGSTDITGSLTALAGQLDQAAQAAQGVTVAPQDPAALIQTIADNTAAAQTGDADALNAVLTAASELANVAQSNYNDATTADAARQQAASALSGAAGALANRCV